MKSPPFASFSSCRNAWDQFQVRDWVMFLICSLHFGGTCLGERTLRVPQDFDTIQAALDAANDGDLVLVDHGVYHEGLILRDKSVTLASRYLLDGDPRHVAATVLDGRTRSSSGSDMVRDQVILVAESAGPATSIVGFTIQGGDDGISCGARITIRGNHFVRNQDGIDYEGGGGSCAENTFRDNRDDAIDLDGVCHVRIERNWIEDNHDDGIEIRFHDWTGELLEIEIVGNVILRNLEDGIQIIDYPGESSRRTRIERNIIADNAMAGIGMMADGNTEENFSAADIPEPIAIINNTLARNAYGVCGGDQVTAFNNAFLGNRITALKRVDGQSRLQRNAFWRNHLDRDGCAAAPDDVTEVRPRMESAFRLASDSPWRNRGLSCVTDSHGEEICVSPGWSNDGSPDLGAQEGSSVHWVEPPPRTHGWTEPRRPR